MPQLLRDTLVFACVYLVIQIGFALYDGVLYPQALVANIVMASAIYALILWAYRKFKKRGD